MISKNMLMFSFFSSCFVVGVGGGGGGGELVLIGLGPRSVERERKKRVEHSVSQFGIGGPRGYLSGENDKIHPFSSNFKQR